MHYRSVARIRIIIAMAGVFANKKGFPELEASGVIALLPLLDATDEAVDVLGECN